MVSHCHPLPVPGSVLQAPSNLKTGLTNSKGFHRLYTATGASQKQSLDRHLQAAADGGPFQELNYWTRANDSILCISSQYAALTTKLGGRATYIAFRLLIQIQVPIRLKINSAIVFISLALMSHRLALAFDHYLDDRVLWMSVCDCCATCQSSVIAFHYMTPPPRGSRVE